MRRRRLSAVPRMAVDTVHAFGAICILSRAVRSRESWTDRGDELSYEPEPGERRVRPTVCSEQESAGAAHPNPFERTR